MPKHSNDHHSKTLEETHVFIMNALKSNGENLSNYKDEVFKHNLRVVAIDSILAIVHKIHIEQVHALKHGKSFSELDAIINTTHPITTLNILDYCLAAGFNDMAIHLIRYGATSKNLPAFANNMHTTFRRDSAQPEIVKNIYTIIEGGMEIKHNYDDFVAKTNEITPKLVGAGKRIFSSYSTAALISMGIGSVLLAPILHVFVHSIGATALLASAGGILPVMISSALCGNNPSASPQLRINQSGGSLLRGIFNMAKEIKAELRAHDNKAKHVTFAKQHPELTQKQTSKPLLHHLSSAKSKQHIGDHSSASATAIAAFKN